MKYTLCFITILLGSLLDLHANSENDSLLKVLDKVISERLVYTEKKEATIKELKAKKKEQKTLDDMYRLNSEILHQYETFVCDSAEQYINENIEIAKNWVMKPTYWKASYSWLLFIRCRGCLFKLMIFSSLSIVRIYQVIYKLCIVGIVFGIMKT